jgi:uncharacterized protein with von Willebrand factor type A (vWA) domain
METIIARFVAELRKEGLRVSPGESLDAVCALGHGGLEGRASVRSLLRLTLVKNVHDLPLFERVFERFFRSGPDGRGLDPADLLQEVIYSMEAEELLGTNPEMINENMTLAGVDAGLSPEDLKDLLGLKEIDLDQLDGSEMEIRLKDYQGAMQDAVSRMLLRLKKDIRRVQNMENRGKIHVIRTIQKNYRNGMVPFHLVLRRRRKQKPRLVVLCDVSFSVSHASQFMLLLLHTLHNRLMDVRSFIFNAELAEITEMLVNAPINAMMEAIDSGKIVNLDDNSDYGKVLETFKDKFLENLRGRPAVIFLGDARNNYNKPNDWVLEQLREKAGYMMWLTPEDRELWKRGDCIIETYGTWCDKVEVVKNVEELNQVVEDLFRNIYLEDEHRAMRSIKKAEEEEPYDYRTYYTRGGGGTPSLDGASRSHW